MYGEQGKREDRWTRAILLRDDIVIRESDGGLFMFRPGECLVDSEVLSDKGRAGEQARAALERFKAEPADGEQANVARALGLVLFRTGDFEGVPELVTELRSIYPTAAALNHVLVGDPHRYGGTGPADPAPRPGDIPGQRKAGDGVTIAVLDTGVDLALDLADGTPTDAEILDEDSNAILDAPAGHGTFVAGIIRRWAPQAKIVARRVLQTPAGIASELEVAQALLSLPEVDIINCSFGGPAQNDAAPLVIERALAKLSARTVVVASAGNQGELRPHYPAASKRVVGVAAVEGGKGHEGWTLAEYSNRGWWVDASAPGTDIVSTFVAFDAPPEPVFEHGARWSGTSFSAPAVTAAIAVVAARDGIPAKEAAYRLIDDPDRLRITDAGTLVLPDHLPPTP